MRFFIDDLEVLFPYSHIYPEQLQYMRALKDSLGKGHALLEMPTGTGKTLTLLSLLVSYQYKHPEVGKIVYCTRTVHEMNKVLSELEQLMEYRNKEILQDQIVFAKEHVDLAKLTIQLLENVGIQAKKLAQEQLKEEQNVKVKSQNGHNGIDDDGGDDGELNSLYTGRNKLVGLNQQHNSQNNTPNTQQQQPTSHLPKKNPFKRVYNEFQPLTTSTTPSQSTVLTKYQPIGEQIKIEDENQNDRNSTQFSLSQVHNSGIKLEPGQIGFDFHSIDDPNNLIKTEDGSLSTYNQQKRKQISNNDQLSLTTGPGFRNYVIQTTIQILTSQHKIESNLARTAVELLRDPNILAICLSARKNMCIHKHIGDISHREKVDTLCRSRTANYIREDILKRLIYEEKLKKNYNYSRSANNMDDIDTDGSFHSAHTYTNDDTLMPTLEPMNDGIDREPNGTENVPNSTNLAVNPTLPCGTAGSGCSSCPAMANTNTTQSTQNTNPNTHLANSSEPRNGPNNQQNDTNNPPPSHSLELHVDDIEDSGLCPYYEGFLSVTNNRSLGYNPLEQADSQSNSQSSQHSSYTDSVQIKLQTQPSQQPVQFTSIPTEGVFDINSLIHIGRDINACPYYMARYLISHSNVIVYNYHYMLDPKVNGIVDKFLEPESIVVFDEAHNIDNICIEALSITVSKNDVFQATRALEKLRNLVHQTEQDNQQKLIDEYNSIVNEIQRQQRQQSQQGQQQQRQQQRQRGQQAQTNVTNRLTNRKNNRDAEEFAELVASPVVLPPDLIQQAIPGSIRRARGFLLFLKSFLEFLKGQLLTTNAREFQPKAFLEVYKQELGLHDISACKFAYDRLSILLTTLNITDFDVFSTLIKIASFITQVANYEAGFVVLYEPFDDLGVSDPRILLTCVDASIAIQPLFNKYASVVITSGTLSPMDLYPKMLNFMPYISRQFTMSLNRNVVVPLIITKGNDQGTISTAYAYRDNDTVTAHYGNLVLNLAKQIPDGIVVFFPSYAYMENILLSWNEAKTDPKTGAIKETLISQILRHKLIFVETKDIAETSLSLQAYKKSCDVGRGGIFFSIARGKVSEGIDFNGHYGRAVVMIGVPYQYTRSRTLLARLEFLKTVLDISEAEYLNFDALRQTSQCLGRIVRSKKDYGLMVLADIRYNRNDIQMKLPRWIRNFIKTGESTSLSIDGGMAQVRTFLRDMSTPHDIKYDYGTVLLNKEQAVRLLEKME